MAGEEDLPPDSADEPIDAPEEEAPPTEEPEQPAPNPVEGLAQELGWVPKEQFRGNPDDWKPAEDFIKAGRDIQRTLSRDVRSLREQVDTMGRTSAALLEQQLNEQRARLEHAHREAVAADDPQAARQLASRINELDHVTVQAPQPSNEPPTKEGQDWARRNRWYGTDTEATAYAQSRAMEYAKQGLSPARQLAAVERDMKELFPEHFPAAPPANKPPAAVSTATSRASGTSSRAKSFHDLPREAQAVARDMAARGVIPSTEAYVQRYFAEAERKVG